MTDKHIEVYTGIIVENGATVSFAELCRVCAMPAEQIITMIEFGVVDPINPKETSSRWQFACSSVLRIQKAQRLQHDLGVNLEGAVLALELLDEIKQLREQLSGNSL